MIEFRWNRVDKRNNNTPIISDAEIDELAEIILGDYKPQLLQEPRKVKYEHFLDVSASLKSQKADGIA